MGNKKAKRNAQLQAAAKKREAILRIYKKKRILNYISTLIIFGTAFAAVWYSNNRASFPDDRTRTLFMVALCSVTVGALVFSFINWRCPSCGKHLGRAVDPHECRKCGFRFR